MHKQRELLLNTKINWKRPSKDFKSKTKSQCMKCSIGIKETPYLSYINTMDGLKPDPKKIQRIMDLEQSKTAKRDDISCWHDTMLQNSLSPLRDSAVDLKWVTPLLYMIKVKNPDFHT